MNEKIEQAIMILAGKIVQSVRPDDALKYTQSALNMAHVKGVLTQHDKGAGSRPAAKA